MKRILGAVAIVLALVLLVASGVSAQEIVVVRAARMLDVESGRIVPNAVVVIQGDKIQAVNPATAPAGAKVIDLGEVTLLPGLMDMHVHLTFDIGPGAFERAVKETSVDEGIRGVRNARLTLMAGFTTVRNVGSSGFSDIALDRAIQGGLVEGPRIFGAGHSLGITGGHCDDTGWAAGILERGPEEGIADGPAQILKAVRYQIKHGAKVIKTCATAGVLSFEGPVGAQQYSEEELRVMAEEVHRHGMKLAAHAHGTEGILAAVRAGVDSIEHGSMLSDEAIALMKQKGTYLVPTTHLSDRDFAAGLPPQIRAKAEMVQKANKESVRKAVRAGVKIAFGTDAAVFPHGENAKEFASLVDRGMSPLDAIRTATTNAADLLGVTDRGTIAAGKLADLVAVPGNPLENIRVMEQVRFVMKGGKIYKQ